VHEHLRHSRVVESFRLADADEGGDGMTKVVLTG
jgi:DNA mismatch repair protein MutS2